ncbi:uncharacterized protein LOC143247562 [Tachypleus tridentatus]|uniref:uncharacterized protein LOC143247562 n=1 Tax=Tachypleus tridentatus TaxID=6853 RepID=UPI003FD3611E
MRCLIVLALTFIVLHGISPSEESELDGSSIEARQIKDYKTENNLYDAESKQPRIFGGLSISFLLVLLIGASLINWLFNSPVSPLPVPPLPYPPVGRYPPKYQYVGVGHGREYSHFTPRYRAEASHTTGHARIGRDIKYNNTDWSFLDLVEKILVSDDTEYFLKLIGLPNDSGQPSSVRKGKTKMKYERQYCLECTSLRHVFDNLVSVFRKALQKTESPNKGR